MERLPSKAFCKLPIADWQLVQIHEVVEPPSCASMAGFPTQKQLFIIFPESYVHVLGARWAYQMRNLS